MKRRLAGCLSRLTGLKHVLLKTLWCHLLFDRANGLGTPKLGRLAYWKKKIWTGQKYNTRQPYLPVRDNMLPLTGLSLTALDQLVTTPTGRGR